MPNDIVQTLTDHYLPLIRQLGYHTCPTGWGTKNVIQHTICNIDHAQDHTNTSYAPAGEQPRHRCECHRAHAITITNATLQLHHRHGDGIRLWHPITIQDLNHPTAIEDFTHILHQTLWP